jgi:SAM-dependent methyltransferase
MNKAELQRNERLDSYVIQNLNAERRLPFGDAESDGVGICVSIDYLTRPVEVLREVGRVLRVGGATIISFSNRCFPSKAVAQPRGLESVEGVLRGRPQGLLAQRTSRRSSKHSLGTESPRSRVARSARRTSSSRSGSSSRWKGSCLTSPPHPPAPLGEQLHVLDR